MTAERRPAEVFRLAEYLCDELVARDWKTADCARRFDNGCSQAFNLLMLNVLMLGHTETPAPYLLIYGLSHALGVSQEFFRALEASCAQNPDRIAPWDCPTDILSMETIDYIS